MIKYLPLFAASLIFLSAPALAEPFRFETKSGQIIPFEVEIARTEAEKNKGLMNRDSIPQNTGMLFVFDPPSKPFFWMKDTRIPLDMIYLDKEGIVTGIHENAVPFDTKPISPPDINSQGVLEISGGDAKKLGISVGDKAIHTIFKKD